MAQQQPIHGCVCAIPARIIIIMWVVSVRHPERWLYSPTVDVERWEATDRKSSTRQTLCSYPVSVPARNVALRNAQGGAALLR